MLIRFMAANHASIWEPQEFSFVASTGLKETEIDAVSIGHKIQLLRTAAIYGANASGKSNVLDALSYMRHAVMNSHRQWKPDGPIPRAPFLLDPDADSKPSTFEVDVFIDDVLYQYRFSLDTQQVQEESLSVFVSNRRQVWFERKGQDFHFGKSLSGENRTIQSLTRPNSLFLSAAAQNNHTLLLKLYSWFARKLHLIHTEDIFGVALSNHRTLRLIENGQKDSVLQFLGAADLGVIDLALEKEPPNVSELMERVAKALREVTPGLPVTPPPRTPSFSLAHRSEKFPEGVKFPLAVESRGTLNWFALAGDVLGSLKSGSVLLIDEIDASLHPTLAVELVRLFNSPKHNPNNAQLLFTTHSTLLMTRKVLRRDQVWFTEKDRSGATRLYPLTDFKPRKQENIEVGYLQGRYGAVPLFDPQELLAALGSDNG